MWPSLGASKGTERQVESVIVFNIVRVEVLNGTPLTSIGNMKKVRGLFLPLKIMAVV